MKKFRKMLLPVLLFMTGLSPSCAARNFASDIRLLVAKFHQFNDTEYVIQSFETLGEDSEELLRLGYRVGQRFVANVNSTLERDVEESRALAELFGLFEGPFALQPEYQEPRELVNTAMASLLTVNRSEQGNAIHNIVSYLYDMFVHPSYLYDPYFYIDFYNINDFETIIWTVNHSSFINCRSLKAEEMNKFVKIQAALQRLGERLKMTLPEQVGEIELNDFLKIGVRAPAEQVDRVVQSLDKIVDSREQPLYNVIYHAMYRIFFDEDIGILAYSRSCSVGKTFGFDLKALRYEMQKIRLDLLRLVLAKAMFGSAFEPTKQDRSPPTDYNLSGPVASALSKTGKEIADWARHIEDLSWPEIGISTAKNAISNESQATNETARKIQKALEKQGPKCFSYQVLVLQHSVAGDSWSVGTEISDIAHRNGYTNVTDINGLDVHIFRFNRTEAAERKAKADEWMTDMRDVLVHEMRSTTAKNASSLLSSIQFNSVIGPIYGKDLYRSVLLMRTNENSIVYNAGLKLIKIDSVPIGMAIDESSTAVVGSRLAYPNPWKMFFFL